MYHIVLSSNERYMPGAMVALSSVAVNAKPESELCFHVFTENVKRETIELLELTLKRLHPKSEVVEHVCDESILNGLPEYAGSRMAWVRCFYSRILKDIDWALYLDCDVLYLASPEEHFSYMDDSVYACVTRDMSSSAFVEDQLWLKEKLGVEIKRQFYFNSGVMLFNFKKFREDNIPEKIVDFVRSCPEVRYADQTAMNAIFNGNNIKMIPEKFNWLQIYLDDKALGDCPVIHYVSGVPWLPKLSTTANGRFRLWHQFADKYVWQKHGESYRRLFSKKILLLKKLLYFILKMPFVGKKFAFSLKFIGVVTNASGWHKQQVGYDVSEKAIICALERSQCNCEQILPRRKPYVS